MNDFTPHGLKKDINKVHEERKAMLEKLLLKFSPWQASEKSSEVDDGYNYRDNELLDLVVSGLSVAQVNFIYSNCKKLDFCINLLGC